VKKYNITFRDHLLLLSAVSEYKRGLERQIEAIKINLAKYPPEDGTGPVIDCLYATEDTLKEVLRLQDSLIATSWDDEERAI
jgi:hypothetical protein